MQRYFSLGVTDLVVLMAAHRAAAGKGETASVALHQAITRVDAYLRSASRSGEPSPPAALVVCNGARRERRRDNVTRRQVTNIEPGKIPGGGPMNTLLTRQAAHAALCHRRVERQQEVQGDLVGWPHCGGDRCDGARRHRHRAGRPLRKGRIGAARRNVKRPIRRSRYRTFSPTSCRRLRAQAGP